MAVLRFGNFGIWGNFCDAGAWGIGGGPWGHCCADDVPGADHCPREADRRPTAAPNGRGMGAPPPLYRG